MLSGVSINLPKRLCATDKVKSDSSMAKLTEVLGTLKKMAPLSLAESWDNVGLLVEPDNAAEKSVDRVFFTNDLTEDVLKEAETVNADLIISYHPPVFTPFKRLTSDAWKVKDGIQCFLRYIQIIRVIYVYMYIRVYIHIPELIL